MSRRLSSDGTLDLESESECIPSAVEDCDEGLVVARRESRPSMTTEDIVEKQVQSLESTGRVWIQRSRADRSRRLGRQHNRGTCGNAHPSLNRGETRWRSARKENRRRVPHVKSRILNPTSSFDFREMDTDALDCPDDPVMP
jgi:hypothetical protein